jgi:hypothetical protein
MASLKGFYAKLKGYCARLALIHALATKPAAKEVGVESIAAAAAQVDYFKTQAAKVAHHLCRSVGVGDPIEKCALEIVRKGIGGKFRTRRELQRNSQFGSPVFGLAWELISKNLVPLFTRHSTDVPTTDTATTTGGRK